MSSISQNSLSDRCINALGLTAQPFTQGDTAPYFAHQNLALQVEAVEGVLVAATKPVYVIGQTGLGKSAFINELTRKLTAFDYHPCFIKGSATHTADGIIQQLGKHFGLQVASPTDDTSVIATHFDKLITTGFQPIIIIDDADQLNINIIRQLARLQRILNDAYQKSIGILLSTDAQDETHIPVSLNEFFSPSEAYIIQLKPLSKEQARAYLKFKFEHSGYTKPALPIKKRFNSLYDASGGVPNLLNAVTVQAVEHSLQMPQKKTTQQYSPAILSIALVFALGTGYTLYQQTAEPTRYSYAPKAELQTATVEVATPVEQIAESGLTTTIVAQASLPTESDNAPEIETIEFSQFQTLPETKKAATSGSPDAITSEFKVDVSNQTAWIASAPPEQYTLQVAANDSSTNINNFYQQVKSAGLTSSLYVTERDGSPWFVVVAGQFDSFSEAQAAVGSMPEWIQSGKPWPRKISLVQSAITLEQ